MPALAIAAASSAVSFASSSVSPSCFWIVFICSRSNTSRWCSSSRSLVFWSMSWLMRKTSMRCTSNASTLSSRSCRSRVSSTSCFSSGFISIRPAIKSARFVAMGYSPATRQFGRCLRQQFQDFSGARLELQHARLDVGTGGIDFLENRHGRHGKGTVQEFEHPKTLLPLANDMVRAVLRRHIAHDAGGGADLIQLIVVGASAAGSRCSRMPTLRLLRTASCAAAIVLSRPMVIGTIRPGNSTILRTGISSSASSGYCSAGLAAVFSCTSRACCHGFASGGQCR